MIFVTHDQEEAMSISDRIVVMNQGKIEQTGTPREIYRMPESVFVAEFIGKANIFKENGKTFMVRPENIRLSSEETDDELSGIAKIKGKEYRGTLILYELENSKNKEINVITISNNREYSIGEQVRYSVDKRDLYEIMPKRKEEI